MILFLRYYKLDQENELYLKRYQHLKETCDISARDLGISKEKCRQLQLKVDESTKNIKNLNEQVFKLLCRAKRKTKLPVCFNQFKIKKIQTQKEQRDKLFKNERSKIEKEIEKLKARIQTLTVAKTKDLQSKE
jgi:hypothetical protein